MEEENGSILAMNEANSTSISEATIAEAIEAPIIQNVGCEINIYRNYTPYEGQEFDSEDAAYNFYYEYGQQTGFNIRKEYGNWNRQGELTSRRFVCCKEGFRDQRKKDQVKNPRPDSRTGCLARLVISYVRERKKYRVSEFVADHNHCLHVSECGRSTSCQGKRLACAVNSDTCNGNWAEYMPREGQEFDSEDAAYNFYIAYARQTGFSIRKEYRNKNKAGELTSRSFVCCKEGFRNENKQDRRIKKLRQETRTGCRAKMVISLDRAKKKYRVSVFVAEHNHWLHTPECTHAVPSQKLPNSEAFGTEFTNAFGITSDQPQNLGCGQDDQRTCHKSKRQRAMRYEEVGNFLRRLEDQACESNGVADGLIGNAPNLDVESSQYVGDQNLLGECTPCEGQEFGSEDSAYDFYNAYGRKFGFSIRKEYGNRTRTGELTSRRFVCCKEGFRDQHKRDHQVKNARPETRTGCPARMVIRLDREQQKYLVSEFVAEHNHCLHLPECADMLPSQRKNKSQASEIDLAKQPDESTDKQSDKMANAGQITEEPEHCLQNRQQTGLKNDEAENLLRYFQQQLLENSSFYYAVHINSERKIMDIFWVDSRMIIDYMLFGDVITFNTTYKNNREDWTCGVFAGFNHHRQTVIFGAAVFLEETMESYKWLFETFLQAMTHRIPRTIFTDQDSLMAKAISLVMPDTYHGLCTWHIMKNGPKHLGQLFRKGSGFLSDFKSCMFTCEDETEFHNAWYTMLVKYNVGSNPWLHSIFELKEKWAEAYMKRVCTLGMRKTQFNETLHVNLKDYLNSDMDLVQLYKQFNKMVNAKRYKELEAEYQSRQKLPKMGMTKSPMLNQAGHVYTPAIFKEFQEQYDEYLATFIKYRNETEEMREYLVAIVGSHEERKVLGNPSSKMVSCSCRRFETSGILCCHALKVLDVMDIKLIPEQYILKRWTKDVRNNTLLIYNGFESQNPFL